MKQEIMRACDSEVNRGLGKQYPVAVPSDPYTVWRALQDETAFGLAVLQAVRDDSR